VFGIQTGVAVCFLVRQEQKAGQCHVHYYELSDDLRREEKLDWFRSQEDLSSVPFVEVVPDRLMSWVNMSSNDWDTLLPLHAKQGDALIGDYFLGVSSNRDEWVYDLSKQTLESKMKHFVDTLNADADAITRREDENKLSQAIKWSRDLKAKFFRNKLNLSYSRDKVVRASYRPFSDVFLYAEPVLVDILFDKHLSFIKNEVKAPTRAILYTAPSSGKPFMALCSASIADLHFVGAGAGTLCLAQHSYGADGTRHDNLTDWGLDQFRTHYGDSGITKEQVFHYVYAVLHDPLYREKYALNLKREFPRIPFYPDFYRWAAWGKELMELHIGYETAEPYPLELVSSQSKAEAKKKKATLLDSLAEPEPLYQREYAPKVKLKADKAAGIIELDELTLLKGVPPEAWHYKLGNRSALEWVLDQYKEKKPSDPTIAEKFNTYRFADHKAHVIDLLKRVCTVSVRTQRIVDSMLEMSNPR